MVGENESQAKLCHTYTDRSMAEAVGPGAGAINKRRRELFINESERFSK
jgi:hypothetical protein